MNPVFRILTFFKQKIEALKRIRIRQQTLIRQTTDSYFHFNSVGINYDKTEAKFQILSHTIQFSNSIKTFEHTHKKEHLVGYHKW